MRMAEARYPVQNQRRTRVIFVPAPDFFPQDRIDFIDPAVPLPVELPYETEDFNTKNLSPEMILAGMLRILASEPDHENAAYFRRFIQAVRPDIFDELTNAAAVKAETHDFDMALEIFDMLEGLFPDQPALHLNKALVLEKCCNDALFQNAYHCIQSEEAGKVAEGLPEVRRFIEKNPGLWSGWFLLGWGLRKLERWEDGIAAFRKALELGGANSDTRNELAICLMEAGDLKAARKELETALFEAPENVKIISNLGVLALKAGKKAEAAGFFRTALEIDPHDPIAKELLSTL